MKCPGCRNGTKIGPNGESWRCNRCGGTGNVPLEPHDTGYQLWTDADSTVLVRLWNTGSMEVSLRPERAAIWGPPITVTAAGPGT